MSEHEHEEQGLTSRVGPVEINWPLTVGYYGGIGVAVAFDLVAPPLAIFIAAIPFMKMLDRPGAARPTRLVSQVLQGVATPVNGDAPSSIRLAPPEVAGTASKSGRAIASGEPARGHRSILAEARQLADQTRAQRPGGGVGRA